MLARSAVRPVLMAARPMVGAQQKNGMATLKEIEQR